MNIGRESSKLPKGVKLNKSWIQRKAKKHRNIYKMFDFSEVFFSSLRSPVFAKQFKNR